MKQNRNILIAVPAFIWLALFSFILHPDTEGLTVLQNMAFVVYFHLPFAIFYLIETYHFISKKMKHFV